MIVNNLIKSAWLATKSGINARVIVKEDNFVVFSFPDDTFYYELRSEADNLTREQMLAETDVCVLQYLKDKMHANKQGR